MKRVIVTVAVGKRPDVGKPEGDIIGTPFYEKLARWNTTFARFAGDDVIRIAHNQLPPESPAHLDNPYAFKVYAIQAAIKLGYRHILWADSSVVAISDLTPIWQKINTQGYWLSRNQPHNTCGEWTSDAALPLLNITREEAFNIPQVAGTAFGIDIGHALGHEFYITLMALAQSGAFKGPWVNPNGEASSDTRVMGHRHDQTAMSVIAHKMKLRLTGQPAFFSDHYGQTDETILTVQR